MKNIKGSLGPFRTSQKGFDRGERDLIISRITPDAIFYRLKGLKTEWPLPHNIALIRAQGLQAGIDLSPRVGRIKRSAYTPA